MRLTAALWIVLLAVLAGCGGGKLPEEESRASADASPDGELPPDHPPVSADDPMAGKTGETDGNTLPLKVHGLNGVEELEKGLAMAGSDEARSAFESGFRKTFTTDQGKRDYAGAAADLQRAIAANPAFPHAYRALGYARFNMGFNVQAAMDNYLKAVELLPDYGEAHYALAFMYAMNDRDTGAVHFRKAMELGVADERGLGQRFYAKP